MMNTSRCYSVEEAIEWLRNHPKAKIMTAYLEIIYKEKEESDE